MNKKQKFRIALVGCGRISRNHFEAIAALQDDLELIAVCDVNADALARATSEHQVAGYSELSRMLEGEQLDLVALCTPSGLHADQAVAAARAGVNVISEKPMATRLSDGLRMVKAFDDSSKRLFVVKQNRFNSTLQLLRRAILDGRFGRIHLVSQNVFWCRPQSYYDQADWRGTWEFDGGAFMNQASHYVDLLDWLVGPVQELHAFTSTTRDIDAEDTGVVNVRWRHGALGSMSVTMLTYPSNLEGSLTILGELGSVRVGGVAVNKIDFWRFADQRDYDSEIESTGYQTTSVYGFGHPRYYRNVVDVMRGVDEPSTDGRSGLRSLELLSAIYRSARDRKVIGLPLEL
jgi:UDP-N-acetyl-2-amino-2-deoxyglucuronate dehydrogenase